MKTALSLSWARLGTRGHIGKFFLEPATAEPLAALRIGMSLVLLWQAFLMRNSFLDFFSSTGFVQGEVSKAINNPSLPSLNWLIDLFSFVSISEKGALTGLGLFYVLSLLLLLFGFFTRPVALITWFLHWSFMNTGYSGSYGADMYAHIFLFYLVLVPAGSAYSLDRSLGRVSGLPSWQARLGLRVVQLHMCISYCASGVEKASGIQWWNGEVLWRALNTPGYSVVDSHWLANVPFIPMLGGWIVLAIETFYCVLVWPKKTRILWVIATCMLHLGIAIFLRLHVFGLLMCIPTIALFAFSPEPVPEENLKCTEPCLQAG